MLEVQKLKKWRSLERGEMLVSAFKRGNQNHGDTKLEKTSRDYPVPHSLNFLWLGTASLLFKMSRELWQTVFQRNKRMCIYSLQNLDSWPTRTSKSASKTMKYEEFLGSLDLLWWIRLTSACMPSEILQNQNVSQKHSGPSGGNSYNSKARRHKFQPC